MATHYSILCDPINCSPPGFSVPAILLQAHTGSVAVTDNDVSLRSICVHLQTDIYIFIYINCNKFQYFGHLM